LSPGEGANLIPQSGPVLIEGTGKNQMGVVVMRNLRHKHLVYMWTFAYHVVLQHTLTFKKFEQMDAKYSKLKYITPSDSKPVKNCF
jgi:hypothetical protein